MARKRTVEVNAGVDLEKRTYLPGVVLRSKCPKCGEMCENDYAQDYFSYPRTGEEIDVTFYCDHGAGHEGHSEWVGARVTIRIVVDVEPVSPPGSPPSTPP